MFSPQSVSVSILCRRPSQPWCLCISARAPSVRKSSLRFLYVQHSGLDRIDFCGPIRRGDLSSTATFGRIAFAFASAIPFSLLWMFEAFPISRPSRLRVLILPGSACVFFVFLSFTKWIVEGATAGSERPNFSYGAFHPLFGVYFLLTFLFALYRLWKKT